MTAYNYTAASKQPAASRIRQRAAGSGQPSSLYELGWKEHPVYRLGVFPK